MTALTNAEKQKAHRRRMAEKMARYEGALREIAMFKQGYNKTVWHSGYYEGLSKGAHIAREALNPTEPAKS